MLALQTGKKVQVLLLHYEALSSLAFLEGSLKWSCLDRRRPKEAFFFFFLCLPAYLFFLRQDATALFLLLLPSHQSLPPPLS